MRDISLISSVDADPTPDCIFRAYTPVKYRFTSKIGPYVFNFFNFLIQVLSWYLNIKCEFKYLSK